MSVGTHMATLNLFKEADGSYEITVVGASVELMDEWHKGGEIGRPVDYVESLVLIAADNIKARLPAR